jgi:hypothetical protein
MGMGPLVGHRLEPIGDMREVATGGCLAPLPADPRVGHEAEQLRR